MDRRHAATGRVGLRGAAPGAWRTAPGESRGAGADAVTVRFDDPVDQAAPGQSVVLYRGDEVLGGGVIRRAA